MKISLAQFDPTWEDKKANFEKVKNLCEKVSADSSLLIFPEMTLTGFTMNTKESAEDLYSESANFFSKLAASKSIEIIFGMIEKSDDYYFNSLIHLSKEGEIKSVYRKIHPFSLAQEDKYYNHGNTPIITEIGEFSVGLSICYDLRFPELYRYYSRKKVDMMINIANWPVPRIEHWKALIKARAIENLSYFVGVNRIGSDPNGNYNGQSVVYLPSGEVLSLTTEHDELCEVEISKEVINSIREKFSFLDDMKSNQFWFNQK